MSDHNIQVIGVWYNTSTAGLAVDCDPCSTASETPDFPGRKRTVLFDDDGPLTFEEVARLVAEHLPS